MSNSPLLSLGYNRGHVRTHDGRSSLCKDQECRLPRSLTKELTHVTLLLALCCGTLVPSLCARALFLAPCGRTLFLVRWGWTLVPSRCGWTLFLHRGARPWCLLCGAGPLCLLHIFTWSSRHYEILKHICYQKCYIV